MKKNMILNGIGICFYIMAITFFILSIFTEQSRILFLNLGFGCCIIGVIISILIHTRNKLRKLHSTKLKDQRTR